MKGWVEKNIEDVIHKMEAINPHKNPSSTFEYIDVSSICNKKFEIVETSTVQGKDAPSRARRLVRKGDILFATIRPTLKRIAQVPESLDEQVCSTGYFVLRSKDFLDARFLFYFLLTNTFMGEMEKLQKGASYPAVTNSEVSSQKILVPPIAEQKRIVALLDEAFEGIDSAIANTEKTLANARELFENYLNAIFARKGDDWIEQRLDRICSIKHGFAFKGEFFTNEKADYIVLTPGSFYESGGYRDQGPKTKYYTGEIPEDYILNEGDFLFAMTEQAVGLLGSSLIVPESDIFLHNQRLGLVQVFDNVAWYNDFFFHQFNTTRFRAAVQDSASGAKVRHTSPKKLGAISVCFPPAVQVQKQVADKLNTLYADAQRLETIYQAKLAALNELKQSILQKAFSGELTTDVGDPIIEAAKESVAA